MHIYLYHALLMMVFTYCICGGASSGAWKEDNVLYKVPGQYAAFPSLRHDGKWRLWVGFGWNTTRSHYGPLAGGRSGRVLLFSPDGGVRWFNEGERYYEPPPADVGALKLSDGTLVRAGARHWEAVTPERARELKAKGVVIRKLPNGRLVATYRAYVRRSTDGGKTWQQVDPKLPTVAMLCSSPARGIVLPDDTIIVPVYGRQRKDEPVMRAWALRATDKGRTWELITVAYDGVHTFNEWAVVQVDDEGKRVLGLLRTEGGNTQARSWEVGFLFQVESNDGGRTWTKPHRTPMWGYPPHLLKLRDGTILATYGYRRPPYGIRACFSYDGGRTWDVDNEVILRHDALPEGPSYAMSPGDLGYPRTVELPDGTLFTVYYITLRDGITHIACTRWSRDYRGPVDLPRGEKAIPHRTYR